MGGDMSMVRMIVDASPVVQIVLGLLLLASMSSWAIIFRKRLVVNRARRDADRFESSFWSGGDLSTLYRSIEARGKPTGMESIFEFGFREFARLRSQGGVAADMLLEGSRRAMRVAQLKEIDRLEQSLATLATVGSTSPYVGLFAAIPAVVAYNRFADQVGRLEVRYDGFMEELSTILQRYAGRAPGTAAPLLADSLPPPSSPARGR